MKETLVYLGTYSLPILFGTGEIVQGKGKGIHIYQIDRQTGTLSPHGVVEGVPNPSYLAVDSKKRFLYAVNELKEYEGEHGGSVSAFLINPETGDLTLLNTKATGGQDPCHVVLDKDDRHLIVTNFMTGSICVYAIEADGSLGERTIFIQHEGGSIDPKRQAGPHAHSTTFDRQYRYLQIPDLGLDKLVTYQLDRTTGKLNPAPSPYYVCEPGAGPRYCEYHPSLPVLYSINELASSISVLRYSQEDGRLTHLQTISTLPQGFDCANTCADLHVTADGRHVYGSNRGHDSLVVYATDPETGLLTVVDHVSTGGRTPRQFAIYRDFVLVGNQDSDCITVFRRDPDTGRLTKTQRINAPTPVCILCVER